MQCPFPAVLCLHSVVIRNVVDGYRLKRYPDDELVLVVHLIAGAVRDRLAVDQVSSSLQGSAALAFRILEPDGRLP